MAFSFLEKQKSGRPRSGDSHDRIITELVKLRRGVGNLNKKLDESNDALDKHSVDMRRLTADQKDSALQLGEIIELMSDPKGGGDEKTLLEALMDIADQVGNFYMLASEDKSSPLYAQAEMMWSVICKCLNKAGITVIDGEECPVDFRLHSPVRTEWDGRIPECHVLKIVKHGYIYNGEVLRRASIVVNKGSDRANDCRN